MEARDIVLWIEQCQSKGEVAAIRDVAAIRLHELEHQDEYGAGKPHPGYKPVTVAGVKRQP